MKRHETPKKTREATVDLASNYIEAPLNFWSMLKNA